MNDTFVWWNGRIALMSVVCVAFSWLVDGMPGALFLFLTYPLCLAIWNAQQSAGEGRG